MEELKKLDSRIAELRQSLNSVKGTETEVYTRIVGYYRSVKNWNLGKKEEYKIRKTFLQDITVSESVTAGVH